MKPVVLVVLWLWPPSLLAYPTITVLPDEEQNMNHYVQVLQNLIMSVPTREQGSGETSSSSSTEDVAEPRSPSLPELLHTPGEVTPENDVLISPIHEEKTTFPTRGFTLGIERRTKPESTAFWSIRPNNISVVLHAEEPYIEKEEPEPEPEMLMPDLDLDHDLEHEHDHEPEHDHEHEEEMEPDTQHRMSTMVIPPWAVSSHITLTTRTTGSIDLSTDSEDVPQLSGQSEVENEDIAGHHSQSLRHEDILRKIANINAEVQHGPLGDANNPEYKEYVEASREHLKRSLALAAAAEHKLQQMYRSRVFPEGRAGDSIHDMESVINMLYNSRFKLAEYLDIKHVPSELRKKVTAVTSVLKKLLCVDQVETQRLIRKLLSSNMKILNILDVP